MTKVYITKYVGQIQEREFKELSRDEAYVYVQGDDWTSYKLDKDAFYELAEAVIEAKRRLAKKIASLKKQITKLEAIRF